MNNSDDLARQQRNYDEQIFRDQPSSNAEMKQAPDHAPWKARFEKYWEAMEPIMIPDRILKNRYEGCFSNGFIAGEFHADTGRTEADHSRLIAQNEALRKALEAERKLHTEIIELADLTLSHLNPECEAAIHIREARNLVSLHSLSANLGEKA